jgi:N-acetylglucosaminyldiphosphoundecaprenol N-acetyl-beta-D-mannosaminyltransferase
MESSSSLKPERFNVLDVGVSAIDMTQALDVIDHWIGRGESHYVCVTGVHGVMESHRNEDLRCIHNAAGLVTPDGMPLVWLAHRYRHHHVGRVYGPDLMLALCERSCFAAYKHFFYGGAEGVPERLAENLLRHFPKLKIVGTYSPPFVPLTDEEDERIVQAINECNPDIVWVGLSTPKQERWMAAHVDRLAAKVLLGVGAAFDIHSGEKRQAPRLMQQTGLEWLFRLLCEPKRLWRRYLVNNPQFIMLIFLQWLALSTHARAVDHKVARWGKVSSR